MAISRAALTVAVMALALAQLGAAPTLATDKHSVAVEWIRQTAIPLATVEAGHGFADLQPLKRVIGDARLVSLGEATHGSREIFQLKHRMIEFLAREMGFTVFAIEANMPEAYRLNDYVLNGTGDPAALLRGMYFWTWDTEEVLALIHWMREFNQSGKGRMQFTGFDMQFPAVSASLVGDFARAHDADFAGEVAEAAAQAKAATGMASGGGFGVATGTFPIAAAAGKRVHFSGSIRTENVTGGWAGLWWRVDGASGVLAFDNMQDRGATGTSEWKTYELDLQASAETTSINFGLLMVGTGTAWFDDLAITLDGAPYEDPGTFDLGFESPTPIGFRTGGPGYEVAIDSTVAHGGRQSLRITHSSATDAAAGPDPKEVAARWEGILEHLGGRRAAYVAAGVPARDADWAIQNARVVLQSLQLKSGEVERDRSMAVNVKWILDQNPGAKVVLWAHDGHVARKGYRDNSMGAVLDTMLPKGSMVVLGSAFNQGSFQSFAKGGQGLKSFSLPPAPADSLDGTLAAAGIPIFALDLRQAPPWFRKPRASRQLGAMYNEEHPENYLAEFVAPKAYDAVLFIDTTTTARKNPGR